MCALEYHMLFPKQNTSGASMTPMLTAVILLDHMSHAIIQCFAIARNYYQKMSGSTWTLYLSLSFSSNLQCTR
jgi:hypothetical protein